ncbi:MAG: enoyl-CoA hydratase/isomerase family protein [Hyphomicrobiales bacterium]|nr:enoyl-CoA hydratase/isomerase family protein [Hyphomicrobiales bacterium]MDE2018336.1 enoyl-CoA hydratase/isomerase family protein [Hyphomicrobiales bacterium]
MDGLIETLDSRGVATLTLDRPRARNAFDGELVAALDEALARLSPRPDVRAVVLAATGSAFCAGADAAWMARMAEADEAANLADARALAAMLRRLDRLPKPTMALVQGPALGGGVGLVACCDVAIASEAASFRLSEVRLGLIPATIGPYVVAAIGARQARRLFLTAESIEAVRAREIGLVHEVVPASALAEAGAAALDAIIEGAPEAQAAAKDLAFLIGDAPTGADLSDETARRIAARRASAEAREGLAAFLEKRPPWWRGGTR